MPLIDNNSEKTIESITEIVAIADYKWIKKSKEFNFDWELEKEYEVYKIYLIDKDDNILGLMSLIDYPSEYRIHLSLIEVGKTNQGKSKKIDNITGCLIAFACEEAFVRNYDGFVSLQPKTQLIELYQEKYGFHQYGKLLCVEQASAKVLIKKYLSDEEK